MSSADWPHGRWTQEHLANGEMHCHRIVEVLHRSSSPLQTVEVVETESYGRGLFLDGRIQHVQADEYIYSESIFHPPAIMLGMACRRILVVGGGPGGVVREAIRHKIVEEVVQVEIDQSVIGLCRDWFPHIADGCYDDARVAIEIADIQDFARTTNRRFDLVIYDVSEPIEGSPAAPLFAPSVLSTVGNLVAPGGLFVTWGGSIGPCSSNLALAIDRAMSAQWPYVVRWISHPHAYGTNWLTIAGSAAPVDPWRLAPEQIDAWLEQHVDGRLLLYDGVTHTHMLSLPKDIRHRLSADDHHGTAVLKIATLEKAASI